MRVQYVPPSDFVDLRQAVRAYPISKGILWKWIAQGRLSTYKPFQKVLLRRSEIDNLIEMTRVHTEENSISGMKIAREDT